MSDVAHVFQAIHHILLLLCTSVALMLSTLSFYSMLLISTRACVFINYSYNQLQNEGLGTLKMYSFAAH